MWGVARTETTKPPSTERPRTTPRPTHPHWPWSLTGVTAPLVVQSTSVGRASLGVCSSVRSTFLEIFSWAR